MQCTVNAPWEQWYVRLQGCVEGVRATQDDSRNFSGLDCRDCCSWLTDLQSPKVKITKKLLFLAGRDLDTQQQHGTLARLSSNRDYSDTGSAKNNNNSDVLLTPVGPNRNYRNTIYITSIYCMLGKKVVKLKKTIVTNGLKIIYRLINNKKNC